MFSYSNKGTRFQTLLAYGGGKTTAGIGYDKLFLSTKLVRPFIGTGVNINRGGIYTGSIYAHTGVMINYNKIAFELAYEQSLYESKYGIGGANTWLARLHYAIPMRK